MPEPKTPQTLIDTKPYKLKASLAYKEFRLALLHNPDAKEDRWLSAVPCMGHFLDFEAYETERQAAEGFIERFHDMIHPVIVAEREWSAKSKGITLLTAESCLPGSDRENYRNRLLIVRPDNLRAEYRYPQFQYFLADSGFGCSPDAGGTKVFGYYLYDGEKSFLSRTSFYGIADPSKLPMWVKERLARPLQAAEDE
jgi:hypothetical protein